MSKQTSPKNSNSKLSEGRSADEPAHKHKTKKTVHGTSNDLREDRSIRQMNNTPIPKTFPQAH